MFFCSSCKNSGRFIFWSWEHWSIGGGAGVDWKFLKWDINPGQFNPLWFIFKLQYKEASE